MRALSSFLHHLPSALRDPIIALAIFGLGILLGSTLPHTAQAAEIDLSARVSSMLCDPAYCGDLSAPTLTAADWMWEESPAGGPAPLDADYVLSDDPMLLVIIYISDDDQYIGPMSQLDAMAYVDAGADYVVQGTPDYTVWLAAAQPLPPKESLTLIAAK